MSKRIGLLACPIDQGNGLKTVARLAEFYGIGIYMYHH